MPVEDSRALYKKKMRAGQENNPQNIDKASTEISEKPAGLPETVPEVKKEEKKKGSGIFPNPKVPLKKEEKKEEDKMEKDKIPEIEKKVNDLKEQVAPVKEKVDALGKEVTELKGKVNDHDKDIKGIKEQLAEFKAELAKCARYYMFWIVFALLGIVGVAYFAQGLVFKEVTWASYIVGILGTAIIATLLYHFHYKGKNN